MSQLLSRSSGSIIHGRWLCKSFAARYATASAVTIRNEKSKTSSHLKAKLEYFENTGQIMKLTPIQQRNKLNKKFEKTKFDISKNSYSPQKALLTLKSKFDDGILQKSNGDPIILDKLTINDLKITSPVSKDIFHSIVNAKKLNKDRLNTKLLTFLLGTTTEQLKDSHVVTKDTIKFLERDEDHLRAQQLCKLAGDKGRVGMNAIIQWLLEKGDHAKAFKVYNDRKKWNIQPNNYTHIILFNGLAKSTEWGKMPKSTIETCIKQFETIRANNKSIKDSEKEGKVICSVEHFNSCLSVLMKNFDSEQETAWDFFNSVVDPDQFDKLPRIQPDSQTYTIFINGLKKYHTHQAELILKDLNLSSKERTLKLLSNQRRMITKAEQVFQHALKKATPEKPPTKAEADADPNLLADYKKKLRAKLVDIDHALATSFLSCYINNFSGTSTSHRLGSHYKFVEQGLTYLAAWCPEIDSMFHFINKSKKSKSSIFEPNDILKRSTDLRIHTALESPEMQNFNESINPNTLELNDDKSKLNPTVIFPPPSHTKNKNRAILTPKEKRLVDFSRPKFVEIYATSNYSKGVSNKKITQEKRKGVNKFLLQLALDGLIALGNEKAFILGVWYIITKWGGVYASRTDIINTIQETGIAKGVLNENYMVEPHQTGKNEGKEVKSKNMDKKSFTDIPRAERFDITPPHDSDILDVMLIENFIYKIHENIHSKNGSQLILEILRVLVNKETNLSSSLQPRLKTFHSIFSVLMKELHDFNDYNYDKGVKSNRLRNVKDNTPKKSIDDNQLHYFLRNLNDFMNCLLVYDANTFKGTKKVVLPNYHIESYNRIIERVYDTTWLIPHDNKAVVCQLHKSILKSGILFYRPQDLIDPREKLQFSKPILKSMQHVYDYLKSTQNLSKNDTKLMLNLRGIFQIDSKTPEALEKFNAHARNVYKFIDASQPLQPLYSI